MILEHVAAHLENLYAFTFSTQVLFSIFNQCNISPISLHKDRSYICYTWFWSAIWRVIIQSSSMLDYLKAVQQARTNFNGYWSHNYTAQWLFRKVAGTNIVNRCEKVHTIGVVHFSINKDFILYLYSRSLPSSDNRSELKSSGSSNM